MSTVRLYFLYGSSICNAIKNIPDEIFFFPIFVNPVKPGVYNRLRFSNCRSEFKFSAKTAKDESILCTS